MVTRIKAGYNFNEACDDLLLFLNKYAHVQTQLFLKNGEHIE